MLIIRLQRVGRRNHAEFRMVVTEHSRAAKSANVVEVVGHHNPHTDTTTIDADKVKGWIEKGAQVSDTVHNLLVTHKIISGDKKNVLPKKTPIAKEEENKDEAEAPAAEQTEEASDEETTEEKPVKEAPEEIKE